MIASRAEYEGDGADNRDHGDGLPSRAFTHALRRLDGTLDIQEDYAPWTYVPELQNGHIKWSPTRDGEEVDYQVRWPTGDDRRNAWLRYGIVGNVGTYIARAARG